MKPNLASLVHMGALAAGISMLPKAKTEPVNKFRTENSELLDGVDAKMAAARLADEQERMCKAALRKAKGL